MENNVNSSEYDGIGRCTECGARHSPNSGCLVVYADPPRTEKFTPGPWVINDDDPDNLSIECAAYADETPGICGSHSPEWKLTEHDARLVAASPRMLKALQDLISLFGDDENKDDDMDEIKEARYAVAEALGATP